MYISYKYMYSEDFTLNNLQDLTCHKTKSTHQLPNKCPVYDTEPSDGEVLVLELWGNVEYLFIAIIPKHTLTRSDNTR